MDSPGEYALEMRQITKDFPGVRALSDVSISVRRGHIHALLGENGAGKSTLVKIIDGVYPHGTFSGEVILGGKPVQFKSPHDAQIKGIGYVPQEITVIDGFTVAENIFVGHWNGGKGQVVDFKCMFERASQLLDRCHIALDPRTPVCTLTASQRQSVMIARALALNPSVLILDEATACLTLDETRNLFDVLRHLREQGCTVLFITHKLSEVLELADCATVMRDGALAANFERDRFSETAIVSAMVGRTIENYFPSRSAAPQAGEALRVENMKVPHPHIAGKFVVDNVGFTLRKGEILGLGGLGGSGRSETVNAIFGRTAHTGQVFLEGRPVCIRDPREAIENGLGLLPEERKREGLLFNFAIRENTTLHSLQTVSHWGVISRSRENEAAESVRKQLAIRAGSVDVQVLTLSGGNQQKVVIGKVLMPRPKVVLLDEPTKGVDVGAKVEIYRLIVSLADQGIGVVLVTSELPELLALSDRIIVLARGRIAAEIPKSEATEQRVMLAATGGNLSR